MNTVSLDSLYRDVHSPQDFDPSVAVDDNHLLVKSYPSLTGTFSHGGGDLPTIRAKSFRLTNAGSSNLNVGQRQVFASRYFDKTNLGVTPDSPSLGMTQVSATTPLGDSEVLELNFRADTGAYTTIPQPPTLVATYVVYFNIKSINSEVQPLGIYTERAGIDINHPAAAIRVKSDLSVGLRAGLSEEINLGGPIELNKWHKATISRIGSDFTIGVDKLVAGSFISVITNPAHTKTSIGTGLLSEMIEQDSFTVAFASEGGGSKMQIDAFEAFRQAEGSEVLVAGTTKEFFCHNNLDEFTVDGAVSGYYRR